MSAEKKEQLFTMNFREVLLPGISFEAARVPWDSELFGVDVYELRRVSLTNAVDTARLIDSVKSIPSKLGASICCLRLEPEQGQESFIFQKAGFLFVEYSLKLIQRSLATFRPLARSMPLMSASPSSVPALLEIGRTAFTEERMCRDDRFPQDIVAARYANWIRNSMENGKDTVLVSAAVSPPHGFVIVREAGSEAQFILAAIAPELRGSGIGALLISSAVEHMKNAGSKTGTTTVSSNNIPVLRVWESLGFIVQRGEQVLHWLEPSKSS
jgi:ribosomal protein S18 acetylase RimI-like enzyme